MTLGMVTKVLIANRGEISLRAQRACEKLGIGCTAVFTEPDALSLHVLQAPESVCLGASPKEYLNAEKLIEVAKSTGEQAGNSSCAVQCGAVGWRQPWQRHAGSGWGCGAGEICGSSSARLPACLPHNTLPPTAPSTTPARTACRVRRRVPWLRLPV